MISNAQLIAMIIVMVGCFVIMITPLIMYRKSIKGVFKIYFAGMSIFFIGDSMLRYSLVNLIKLDNIVLLIIIRSLASVALALIFRVFILKGLLNQEREINPIRTGIILGFGQAAMEAFVILISVLGNYQISKSINDGTIYDLVGQGATLEDINNAISILTNQSILEILSSLLITALYVIIHIGFALMIIRALKSQKNKEYILTAVIYFCLVLSETILVSSLQPMLIRLGVMFVFALIMGYYVFNQVRKENVHVGV